METVQSKNYTGSQSAKLYERYSAMLEQKKQQQNKSDPSATDKENMQLWKATLQQETAALCCLGSPASIVPPQLEQDPSAWLNCVDAFCNQLAECHTKNHPWEKELKLRRTSHRSHDLWKATEALLVLLQNKAPTKRQLTSIHISRWNIGNSKFCLKDPEATRGVYFPAVWLIQGFNVAGVLSFLGYWGLLHTWQWLFHLLYVLSRHCMPSVLINSSLRSPLQ